jgi:thioredoxin 1
MAENIVNATGSSVKEYIDSGVPVVIDFWAEWCGPCKKISPILDEIAGSLGDSVKFLKINVDNEQEVAADYQVMSIPTLVFIKEGEEVDRTVGALNKDSLLEKINQVFGL